MYRVEECITSVDCCIFDAQIGAVVGNTRDIGRPARQCRIGVLLVGAGDLAEPIPICTGGTCAMLLY